jgi:hypothetical protein
MALVDIVLARRDTILDRDLYPLPDPIDRVLSKLDIELWQYDQYSDIYLDMPVH